MSDAPLTNDHFLHRLRAQVNPAHMAGSNVSLHPDQVFALVQCAEVLMHINNSHDTRMNSANWERVQKAVARLESL